MSKGEPLSRILDRIIGEGEGADVDRTVAAFVLHTITKNNPRIAEHDLVTVCTHLCQSRHVHACSIGILGI
jgi:hypothetical protein